MFSRKASAAAAAAPMDLDGDSVVDMVTDAVSVQPDSPITSPPPLKRVHSDASTLSSRSGKLISQQQIASYVDVPSDPLNCILMMLVMNGFPLSAVDDLYVRKAFQRVAETGFMLSASRFTMRNRLIRKHKVMKGDLIRKLGEPSTSYTIACPQPQAQSSRNSWTVSLLTSS
jgi:hypothetical protein